MQNNWNNMRKIKGGQNREILLTRLGLKRLNPHLEFPNSRINPILLGGINTTLEYTYSKFKDLSWHLNLAW